MTEQLKGRILPKYWDRKELIRVSQPCAADKFLLTLINDYGGDNENCFAAVETLAADMSRTKRAVQLALQRLAGFNVIIRKHNPGKTNNFFIDWNVLGSLSKANPRSGVTRKSVQVNTKATKRGNENAQSRVTSSWHPAILAFQFKDLEFALLHFPDAVSNHACARQDRIRFLTLWVHVSNRWKQGKSNNPGGLFMSLL